MADGLLGTGDGLPPPPSLEGEGIKNQRRPSPAPAQTTVSSEPGAESNVTIVGGGGVGLPVTSQMRLRLRAFSVINTHAINFEVIILDSLGRLIPSQYSLKPSTTNVPIEYLIDLPDGFIVNASVALAPSASAYSAGRARIELIIPGITLQPATVLLDVPVSRYDTGQWPVVDQQPPPSGGMPYTLTGLNPNAGDNPSVSLPNDTWFLFQSAEATLVTNATAATRIPFIRHNSSVATYIPFGYGLTGQNASATKTYFFHAGQTAGDVSASGEMCLCSPESLWMGPDAVIDIETTSLQAGDDWSLMRVYGFVVADSNWTN